MSRQAQLLGEFMDACTDQTKVPSGKMWMQKLKEFLDQDGENSWQRFRDVVISRDTVRDGFAYVLRFVMKETIRPFPWQKGHIVAQEAHRFLQEVHQLATAEWGLELTLNEIDGPVTWEEDHPKTRKHRNLQKEIPL